MMEAAEEQEDHLSEENIALLSTYQLRGAALVAALKHIEVCEECRCRVKGPTKAEIRKRLTLDRTEKDRLQETNPRKHFG